MQCKNIAAMAKRDKRKLMVLKQRQKGKEMVVHKVRREKVCESIKMLRMKKR